VLIRVRSKSIAFTHMEAQGPPLLRLVFEGDVRAVEAYLGAKTEADATEELNERGADGYTPLMHAVMMGDKDMAEMMLRYVYACIACVLPALTHGFLVMQAWSGCDGEDGGSGI
jgi:ankyrin repeat protein